MQTAIWMLTVLSILLGLECINNIRPMQIARSLIWRSLSQYFLPYLSTSTIQPYVALFSTEQRKTEHRTNPHSPLQLKHFMLDGWLLSSPDIITQTGSCTRVWLLSQAAQAMSASNFKTATGRTATCWRALLITDVYYIGLLIKPCYNYYNI